MVWGAISKTWVFSDEAEEIRELIKKIEKINNVTSLVQYNDKNKELNISDLNYVKLNEELVEKIIHLANVSHQNNLPLVNRTYFKEDGYDIKENVNMFFETLNFYKLIDISINYNLIEYIEKVLKRFSFGKKDTVKYTTYLADAYFDINQEKKAYDIVTKLIDTHPKYDESYQVMINWYMYKKENIKMLERILRKANSNNHVLVAGSFIYEKIIEYYNVQDKDKYEYYKNIYEKWKLKNKI